MKRWNLVWKLWVAMFKGDDYKIESIVDELIQMEQDDHGKA